MTWLTTSDLYEMTGITGTDSFIQRALDYAEKDIIKTIFISKTDVTTEYTTDHNLQFGFAMDLNGDSEVTTSDIDIYEVDNLDRRYDLNSFKSTFTEKEKRLILTELKPTTGRNMFIEYKIGREWFSDMLLQLQEAEALIASNWIFNKNPISKLQDGISSWNLNGVDVKFDSDAMRQTVEDNNKLIRDLYNKLRPKRPTSGFRIGEGTKYPMFRRNRGRLM